MRASVSALCLLAAACGSSPASEAPPTETAGRVSFGVTQGLAVTGVRGPLRPESDELPRYALFVGPRQVATGVLDAAVDESTGTLAWIDAGGTLWLAPAARAPEGRRAAGAGVLPGLATHAGRLAFAERTDGPETAPFVVDLRTLERIALDDGPGPDEILAFSPDGRDVLLLSGRTGLASLFAVGAGAGEARTRQLTNVGLRPGPWLDPDRVTPAPQHYRDVRWGPEGITYGTLTISPEWVTR